MSDDLDRIIEEALGHPRCASGILSDDELRAVAEAAYTLGHNVGGHEVDGDLLVAEGKGYQQALREVREKYLDCCAIEPTATDVHDRFMTWLTDIAEEDE